MYNNLNISRKGIAKRSLSITCGIAALLIAVGCADNSKDAQTTPQPSAAVEQSRNTADDPGAKGALNAGIQAVKDTSSLELTMALKQDITVDGETSSMTMKNSGSVVLEPLAVKQKTENDYMGEKSAVDSYLTSDGYYMYDPAAKAWSRMLADEVPKIKATLSDFQIAPAKELERIMPYAESFRSSLSDGSLVLDYKGSGSDKAADALVRNLLRSTMGIDDMEARVRDSIKVSKLDYRLVFEEKTGMLKQLVADAEMTIEYDPGNPSTLKQSLTIDYSKWNEAEPVIVPEEAKNAPEVMPLDQGLIDALGEEGLEEFNP
ncbi:hypothetical protein M3223_09665 [Paenibacillus pasadenensis]|uniref:DUF6612 family protein n=1 Tax=Paenibacillus pasadenensis TaxID=217090 RepID=UPI00203B7EAF|nr:DUF6612 family protein [Paenibacillus pasadenensis]MCM3747624.1 hypothetical protein [Paenibacillus pasadenensis]